MKKTARRNLLFTAAVLALAAVLFGAQRLVVVRAQGGPVAVLRYGDPAQELEISLAQDGRYDIDTGFYTVHLRVRDGAIAFVDSPCPDHLCEGFGELKAVGDWAACLPAYAALSIEEQAPQ